MRPETIVGGGRKRVLFFKQMQRLTSVVSVRCQHVPWCLCCNVIFCFWKVEESKREMVLVLRVFLLLFDFLNFVFYTAKVRSYKRLSSTRLSCEKYKIIAFLGLCVPLWVPTIFDCILAILRTVSHEWLSAWHGLQVLEKLQDEKGTQIVFFWYIFLLKHACIVELSPTWLLFSLSVPENGI